MADKITFGDVHRLLIGCGFDRAPRQGTYVVFKHNATGALQAFRAHRAAEVVDRMTLASVRKTLVGFGLMEESEFEGAVQELPTERSAKAKRD